MELVPELGREAKEAGGEEREGKGGDRERDGRRGGEKWNKICKFHLCPTLEQDLPWATPSSQVFPSLPRPFAS